MTEKEGNYLYCIIEADEERHFSSKGIGDREDSVYSICYRDIGAVISPSPDIKYSVNRTNTMAHQKVMEETMADYPMLPVRFGTIGENAEVIKEKVLKARYDELKALLTYVEDKVELGLKALWTDKETLFIELVRENKEIRLLRDRLKSRRGGTQRDQVKLGEMVKNALEMKNEKEEKAILGCFKALWTDQKTNHTMGDQMITNSAFLVKKENEKGFDRQINKLSETYGGRTRLKYVGPVPPCNFIEIVVKW